MKIFILFFVGYVCPIHAQEHMAIEELTCGGIRQHINMEGFFNIEFLSEKDYSYVISNADTNHYIQSVLLDTIELKQEFKRKFPTYYNGDSLFVRTRKDTSKIEIYSTIPGKYPSDSYKLWFISKVDRFYMIYYDGFEVEGCLIFDSKDKLFYETLGMPIFSKKLNKIFAFGKSLHMGFNFVVDVIDLDYPRQLSYSVNGYTNVKDWHIINYKNNSNYYALAFTLNRPVYQENEYGEIVKADTTSCNLKILIE